jgi:hypothetical protein
MGEAVVLLTRPTLQLLRATVKERGEGSGHETLRQERNEEQALNQAKNTYLKGLEQRAPVDPQHLSQGVVDEGVVITELLPQRLLGLGLVE